MRPLLENDLPTFLKRFDNFIDCEFRSIEVISPAVIKVTLAGQDSARGFDWISVSFEFSSINDARLLENSKLPHLDMSDGISIIYTNSVFAFAIGTYNNLSGIKNSTCYITSSSLKYAEGLF